MSSRKIPYQQEQESQGYEEQDYERELMDMLNTISECLQIPLPQNPFSFQYADKIMRTIFSGRNQYRARNWAEFIKFLQQNVTEEVAELQYLSQNKENEEQIFQILALLTDLAKVAAGSQQQQQQQQHQQDQMPTGQDENEKKLEQQRRRQQAINQSERYLKSVKQQLTMERKQKSLRNKQKAKEQLFSNKRIHQKEICKQKPKKLKQSVKEENRKNTPINLQVSKRKPTNTRPSTAVNATTSFAANHNRGNKQENYNRRPNYPVKIDPRADLETQIIRSVKEAMNKNLNKRDPKTCKLMHDEQGDQAVKKAKRVFDYELQQYRRQLKRAKQNKKANQYKVYFKKPGQNTNQNQYIDSAYLKYIAKKHKTMEETIINQQLQYYIALRDKKLNYIKNINNLMLNLQKQRQIDLHKKQMQQQRKEKQAIKKKIDAIQNIFTGNLEHLKQQYKKRKTNAQIKGVNEIKFCRQIQRQIVKKKQSQMEEMKVLWEQQCRKLQGITGDQQKVQKKLLKIYRESRV